jgi:hypothetical protein
MLKKAKEKDPDPLLVEGVNVVREMLMNRGYFVKDVFQVSEEIIDLIALREGLLHSDRLRVRLILPVSKGGLSIPAVRQFFADQAKVFNLEGLIISMGPIPLQTQQFIAKRNLNVRDLEWFKDNAGEIA